MVRHIVMWRVNYADSQDKKRVVEKLKNALETLPSIIPEIQDYSVGINCIESERAADLVLDSSFESLVELEKYRVHPEHLKIVELFKKNTSEGRVVDYEY